MSAITLSKCKQAFRLCKWEILGVYGGISLMEASAKGFDLVARSDLPLLHKGALGAVCLAGVALSASAVHLSFGSMKEKIASMPTYG